jgi:hypothetical protein
VMCESCKTLAERSRAWQYGRGGNRHLNHLRKAKPHCEYPETCTCQHRKIADGFVPKEERES